LSGLNLSAAIIKPKLPSLTKSDNGELVVTYCLATVTTNLRFLVTNSSLAIKSPLLALIAHSLSSSAVKGVILEISLRYLLNDSLSLLVILELIPNNFIFS
jgi:hypothetical protein